MPSPATIRASRRSLGLTQSQAGSLVGGSRRTWQNWEAGIVQMPTAKWELFQIKTKGMVMQKESGEYKVHLNSEVGAVEATEVRYSDSERGIKQIAGRALKSWAMEAIFFRRLGFDEFGNAGYYRISL